MKKPCGVFVITYGNDSNPVASGFGTLRSVQRVWEHLAQFGKVFFISAQTARFGAIYQFEAPQYMTPREAQKGHASQIIQR